MESSHFFNRVDLTSDFVAIVIVVAAVILILCINRYPILHRLREWHSRRGLDQLGSEQIHDFRCPDGLDDYYRIDRLVLTNAAILLINHKPFGGNIFCAEKIDQWTQVIGQKSFKFDNPLFELHHQSTALQALVGKAEIHAYLYFDQTAEFPKGHPSSVMHPGSIPEAYLAENCQNPRVDIQVAWQRLQSLHRSGQREDTETGEQAGA